MKQAIINKENVKDVLDTLNRAKWVTVEEAKFLSELLIHIRNQNSSDNITTDVLGEVNYPEKTVMFGEGEVFNSLFNKFTFTVADMNCYIGYPFTKDPHYSYYAQLIGLTDFFISGSIRYFIGEKIVGTTTLVNELIEKSRRKRFFTYNETELQEILTFISDGFIDYNSDSYVSKFEEILISQVTTAI